MIKSSMATSDKQFRLIDTEHNDPKDGEDFTAEELRNYISKNDKYFDNVGLDYIIVNLNTGEEMDISTFRLNSSRQIKSSRVMTAEEADFHEGDIYKNRYGWVIIIDKLDGDYVHIVEYLDENPEEKETHIINIPKLYEHLRNNHFTNMTKGKIDNPTQSFVQSAVNEINEEDPVEVLLKDAAEHFGATYREGWYGKGIQEGDGDWSGGEWAILVDSNPSSEIPEIHFIAAKGNNKVVPMNGKTVDGETFPTDLIDWIENKIRESKEQIGDFEDQVNKFKNIDMNGIDYINSNPSSKTVYIKTSTKSDSVAEEMAGNIAKITGNDNYMIYDFYETSEDSYDDLDSDIRDEKVIIFNL